MPGTHADHRERLRLVESAFRSLPDHYLGADATQAWANVWQEVKAA